MSKYLLSLSPFLHSFIQLPAFHLRWLAIKYINWLDTVLQQSYCTIKCADQVGCGFPICCGQLSPV